MSMIPALALIGPIGWPELLVIGLVALLLFGKRLPEVMRSLGDGLREFKKGVKDTTSDWNAEEKPNPYAAARPPLSGTGQDHRVAQNDPVAPESGVDRPEPAEAARRD